MTKDNVIQLGNLRPEVKEVYQVSNKVFSLIFEAEHDADNFLLEYGSAAANGLSKQIVLIVSDTKKGENL